MREINLTKRVVLLCAIIMSLALVIPGYLRACKVLGDSDAPALVTGDRILVCLLAYDLRLPYMHRPALRIHDPEPGDMVMFRDAGGRIVFKRVVAGPGTRIAMRENHLFINGRSLDYERIEAESDGLEPGRIVEYETGDGWGTYISFTAGHGARRDLEEILVPPKSYYVIGSNRDLSEDSRHYGPIHREQILGQVVCEF